MKLRGIDYGNILGASGVQGFFGEGYSFHRVLRSLGPRFDGMTFVAKTSTLFPQPGNMPLTDDLRPVEFKPKCIWIDLFRCMALNAIALSGPGIEALLIPDGPRPTEFRFSRWQAHAAPFMISFMPIGKTAEERLEETQQFVVIFKRYLPDFMGRVALQFNVSCPSVGLDPTKLASEVGTLLDVLAELGIPIMPKFNVLVPPELVVEMSKHEAYDATCISNTIPFGKLEDELPWDSLFPYGSPLARFGGGGLSGTYLLPIVGRWVSRAYTAGMAKPMNVGGGILSTRDVDLLLRRGMRPGVDSVFIGSVAMLRPWRVQGIIRYANKVLSASPALAKTA